MASRPARRIAVRWSSPGTMQGPRRQSRVCSISSASTRWMRARSEKGGVSSAILPDTARVAQRRTCERTLPLRSGTQTKDREPRRGCAELRAPVLRGTGDDPARRGRASETLWRLAVREAPRALILSAFRPQSCHLASDRQFPDVVGVVISDDQATPEDGVLAGTVGHRREELTGRIPDELDNGFQILMELRERLAPLGCRRSSALPRPVAVRKTRLL